MSGRASALIAPTAAAALAVAGAVYLGGTASAPTPGSDEHIDGETRRVNAKAQTDLATALKTVAPCEPTKDQVSAVLDALGRLQGVGTDTDAIDTATKATMRRPAQAIARAFARGEATGYTGPIIDNLAKWSGIDTLKDGWMNDPGCGWIAAVHLVAPSAVPGIGGKLEMNARVPLIVSAQGAVSSTPVRTQVAGEMQPPPPCNSAAVPPAATMVTITGTLRGDTFDLKLAWGAVSLDVTIACDLPTGRVTSTIPTPLNAVNDLPITLAARDGAQGSDPRAGITVTMSQRP